MLNLNCHVFSCCFGRLTYNKSQGRILGNCLPIKLWPFSFYFNLKEREALGANSKIILTVGWGIEWILIIKSFGEKRNHYNKPKCKYFACQLLVSGAASLCYSEFSCFLECFAKHIETASYFPSSLVVQLVCLFLLGV